MTAKQRAFLAAFATCGVIKQASEAASCDASNHRRWIRESDEYAKAFADAKLEANDALESEARRRAVAGWDEPVFHNGEKCGTKRRYSDAMLIFLMKGAMPEKYSDRVVQTQKQEGTPKVVVYLPDNGRTKGGPSVSGPKPPTATPPELFTNGAFSHGE
ncbi:MAG: hypothetical protein AAGK09_15090 [Planctomycetota bacterium]